MKTMVNNRRAGMAALQGQKHTTLTAKPRLTAFDAERAEVLSRG